MTILDRSLASTLAALSSIPDNQMRLDAFTGTIIAEGGSIVLPCGDRKWGPGRVEFSLMGIIGWGADPSEAMGDWMRRAACCLERLDDAPSPLGPEVRT